MSDSYIELIYPSAVDTANMYVYEQSNTLSSVSNIK